MFHYVVVCSFSFGVSWIFCVFPLISNHLQMFSATTASARKDKFTADTRATMPMPVDLVRPIIYTFTKQIFIIICLIFTLNCQGRPIAMAAWKVRQINEDTSKQKYVISICNKSKSATLHNLRRVLPLRLLPMQARIWPLKSSQGTVHLLKDKLDK